MHAPRRVHLCVCELRCVKLRWLRLLLCVYGSPCSSTGGSRGNSSGSAAGSATLSTASASSTSASTNNYTVNSLYLLSAAVSTVLEIAFTQALKPMRKQLQSRANHHCFEQQIGSCKVLATAVNRVVAVSVRPTQYGSNNMCVCVSKFIALCYDSRQLTCCITTLQQSQCSTILLLEEMQSCRLCVHQIKKLYYFTKCMIGMYVQFVSVLPVPHWYRQNSSVYQRRYLHSSVHLAL